MLISLTLFVTPKRGWQHIQCEHFDLFYDSLELCVNVCTYVCMHVYVCTFLIVALRSVAKDIRFEYAIVTLC